MPAATKKLRAPAELEASEPLESPEDEVREGSEDAPRPSRKRGAKNAKRTKAPMDSEGCGCGGKKGSTCDGGCASKRKRSDALTPQEYLTACELGIEQRSRSYIRARLDAAARLDLKCGNGSISPGEKCTKGAAQKARQPGATGGGIAGAFRRAGERRRQRREFEAPIAAKFKQQQAEIKAAGKAREATIAAKYKEQRAQLNAKGASRAQKREADIKAAMQLAQTYDNTRKRLRSNDMRTATRLAKGYDHINKRRGDSIYATGFSPELDQLAI